MNEEDLKEFISFESVAGNILGNTKALSFLKSKLSEMGFECDLKGQTQTDQPVFIAHRPAVNSKTRVLIYNHYDVEPAKGPWISGSPFELKEINGRLYGRGIADNKGPLWARMCSFETVHKEQRPCPEVLWMIQGEEEVKNKETRSQDIFKDYFHDFQAHYYVEETGYHDLEKADQVVFLWCPMRDAEFLRPYRSQLEPIFKEKKFRYKHEHLSKFASVSPCPFLSNLPADAVYVGFGPNDPSHNIHGKNESLDKARLLEHIGQFKTFLSLIK